MNALRSRELNERKWKNGKITCGWARGRRAEEVAWAISSLTKIQKRRGGNLVVHSIGIKKIFDMIEWEEIIINLREYGAPEDLVKAIARELNGHTLEFGFESGTVTIHKNRGLGSR